MKTLCKPMAATVLVLALAVFPAAAAEGDADIEPKAAQIMKQMSDYMTGLQQFTFEAANATEVVLKDSQIITVLVDSKVSVKRPNKARSDRTGELTKLQLFYDGQTLTCSWA